VSLTVFWLFVLKGANTTMRRNAAKQIRAFIWSPQPVSCGEE